jgi:hypothetical protein
VPQNDVKITDTAKLILNALEEDKSQQATSTCPACFVRNTVNTEKCFGCGHLFHNKDIGITRVSESSKWECTVCLVQNEVNVLRCVCCESVRNDVKSKVPVHPPDVSKTYLKVPESTIQNAIVNEWLCEVCLVKNPSNLNTCLCCETKKPREMGTGPSLENTSVMWECKVCLVSNKDKVVNCVCCDEARPKSTEDSNLNISSVKDIVARMGVNELINYEIHYGIGMDPSCLHNKTMIQGFGVLF